MPTGYTAGLVDGTIKTFPEFAKICMRAFGATMHMRDDGLDEEYRPSVPSTYYTELLARNKKELKRLEKVSDATLEKEIIKNAKKSLKNATDMIDKKRLLKDRLEAILTEVNAYVPPTKEHEGFKTFMIEQISSTINWDTSVDFYEREWQTATSTVKNPNVKAYRRRHIKYVKDDIKRNIAEQKKETKRCADANKWVSDLIKSLNKIK
jgi:hypothetical protein